MKWEEIKEHNVQGDIEEKEKKIIKKGRRRITGRQQLFCESSYISNDDKFSFRESTVRL